MTKEFLIFVRSCNKTKAGVRDLDGWGRGGRGVGEGGRGDEGRGVGVVGGGNQK